MHDLFPSTAEYTRQQRLPSTHKVQAKWWHHSDSGPNRLPPWVHLLCFTLGSFSSSSSAFGADPGARRAPDSFPQSSQPPPSLLSRTCHTLTTLKTFLQEETGSERPDREGKIEDKGSKGRYEGGMPELRVGISSCGTRVAKVGSRSDGDGEICRPLKEHLWGRNGKEQGNVLLQRQAETRASVVKRAAGTHLQGSPSSAGCPSPPAPAHAVETGRLPTRLRAAPAGRSALRSSRKEASHRSGPHQRATAEAERMVGDQNRKQQRKRNLTYRILQL